MVGHPDLERAMEWIRDDELVEVPPKSIRIRKTILNFDDRKRGEKKRLLLDESSNAIRSRPTA